MNLKIIVLVFISIFFGNNIYSQGFAMNFGYEYIGKSAGFVGLEYRLTDNSYSSSADNIGLGSYLTTYESKFILIPEIHYTKNLSKETGYFSQLSMSTKNIVPSVGINLLNAIQLKLGYSIPFQKNNGFKGINFGLNIFIGQDQFYDHLKMGF